jgi:hypothetical protein
MNLEARMRQSIKRRKGSLILRSDVNSLGSKTQVTHVLNLLMKKGEIIRLAKGVYVKSNKEMTNGHVIPLASLDVIIREAAEKLDLIIHGDLPHLDYEDAKVHEVLVEIENPRIDRTLTISSKKIHFISCKRKGKTELKLQRVTLPSKGVAGYVKKLAHEYGVTYVDNSMDKWASAVTRLAGDEVTPDPVQDLLIALKRAEKISKRDVAILTANYLRERNQNV